ncbi:hypothetical protein E1A91_A02G161000v1 [Gossypium mustelinum]|uniref:Secreted protein n=1 Tax=Gossypium mustelinum TaxID=34275 RepID=A0A5D3A859_GOSMU|nr:hypothetical protein E1A91_A02G161000v1 [Gossypium mustelinum]
MEWCQGSYLRPRGGFLLISLILCRQTRCCRNLFFLTTIDQNRLLGLLTFNKRKGAGIEHLMLKKGTKLWLDR